MTYSVFRSYILLVRVDATLRWQGLKHLYDSLREQPIRAVPEFDRIPYELLCHSIDLACVFYPKSVACLQRSSAAVLLLRQHGWPAALVTGCSLGTFEDHAWAEIDGHVVNDKSYVREMYQEIDRR